MGKSSLQLIRVSESMLVFDAENFDGEKTTKVTCALGRYCNSFYANWSCSYYQYFCIEDRRHYAPYLLLSTLEQTCIHMGELRLHLT